MVYPQALTLMLHLFKDIVIVDPDINTWTDSGHMLLVLLGSSELN